MLNDRRGQIRFTEVSFSCLIKGADFVSFCWSRFRTNINHANMVKRLLFTEFVVKMLWSLKIIHSFHWYLRKITSRFLVYTPAPTFYFFAGMLISLAPVSYSSNKFTFWCHCLLCFRERRCSVLGKGYIVQKSKWNECQVIFLASSCSCLEKNVLYKRVQEKLL